MKIKSNLKYLRIVNNFSYRKLGQEVGISHVTLHHIEHSNIDNPSVKDINRLAIFFGVSLDDFVNKDLETLDMKRKEVDDHNSTNK